MNNSSGRHLDYICISILTLATIILVGTFGAIEIAIALGAQSIAMSVPTWALRWIVVGVMVVYLVCLGHGLMSIFETTYSRKYDLARKSMLWFIVFVGAVFILVVAAALPND